MPYLQQFQTLEKDIRDWLVTSAAWRRYDFITVTPEFEQADRGFFVDQLLRSVSPNNDLRFIFQSDSDTTYVFAERLNWDSEFFGYQIARLNAIFSRSKATETSPCDFTAAVAALVAAASERGIRYLYAPTFPENLALIRGLSNNGFSLIETRLLYHMPLAEYSYPNRYPVRHAQPADLPILRKTARESVNKYDRFHADPFILPDQADHLMEEWITASIKRNFADVTLVPDVEKPEAFTTVRYHREQWPAWGYKVAQTVLSAVAPPCRGWHKKLVSETNYHLKEMGVDHSVLPTQITNRAVIHNLEQLGFHYGRSEHIFRLIL
jgi:hypothetical protein